MKNSELKWYKGLNTGNLVVGITMTVLIGGLISLCAPFLYTFGIASQYLILILTSVVIVLIAKIFEEYSSDKKSLLESDKKLEELKNDFVPEDILSFDKERILKKAIEKGTVDEKKDKEFIKKFNPYYLIALWYIADTKKKVGNINTGIDLTYKIIKEMKENGYTNEEIAEELMMEMAEFYDCDKKLKEMTAERIAIRNRLR